MWSGCSRLWVGRWRYDIDPSLSEREAENYHRPASSIRPGSSRSFSVSPIQEMDDYDPQVGGVEKSATCVHRMFEARAAATPDSVAVISDRGPTTYEALNNRANRVAHELLRAGVGNESLVGVFTSRLVDTISVYLGILKAGAAYIPLDPDYPAQRLAFLLADSGAELCVAPRGGKRPCGQLDCTILELPENETEENPCNPGVGVSGASSAYVIYTSGSTGTPKGVIIEHRGLTSLMQFTRHRLELSAKDRVLQFASLSFDASILEIFAALVSGAALVLSDGDCLRPGPGLHRLLKRRGITIAVLSPSVLRVLPADDLDHLRVIITGTERCTADVVHRWAPGRRFFNGYGPTECTIYSTILEVDGVGDDPPSIGFPVPGTHVFVLDEHLRPVGDGESGELCIGGVGVARGYLNRPELTSEKFVTLTLDDDEPRRIYRTGDRARFLGDGSLEYLGRMDFQVKIRGYRVEPGEVEIALEEHHDIASAVVVEGRDAQQQAELWAYYLCRAQSSCTAAGLRHHLSRKLPVYMVPTAFTRLDRWPLTANGKLDRAALPPPRRSGGNNQDREPGGHGQMSVTERQVARMCREILGIDEFTVTDDLFDFGLHSLLIAQLAWKIERMYGATLTYRDIFDAPTVSDLARKVTSTPHHSGTGASSPVAAAVRLGKPPLSFAQERVWFLEHLDTDNRAYQAQALLSFRGALEREVLKRALDALVARHEILRTTFPVEEGLPYQLVHPPLPADLSYDDLAALPPEDRLPEARRRIEKAGRLQFQVNRLPLIRWHLYRVADDHHLLLHHEHHFLHDGWSYGVLLRELFELYVTFASGAPASLPPTAIQYSDFACWQRAQMNHGAYRDQLDYWLRELKDLPARLALCTDRPRPSTQTFNGDQLRMELDHGLYSRLTAECSAEGVTTYMWLHAVFQTLLHRYTGATDICVGSGFANRSSPELENMLGMVINTVVIRGDFSGEPTFAELLRRFRLTIIEAADNQDVPFEKVVQALNPERCAGQQVLFNTFFDTYSRPYPRLSTEKLRVTREDGLSNRTAKFDLVVLVMPKGDRDDDAQMLDSAVLIWEYNTDLFNRETARRMLGHFQTLLESSLDDRRRAIDALPMCSSEERMQLLSPAFCGESVPYPSEATIHGLFEEQVLRSPEATAVVSGRDSLTYRELDESSSRLAGRLQAQGVSRDVPVGVLLESSVELVVSWLGVLKAGGAYLPLDPEYPTERLQFMLRDTGAPVLLTQASLSELAGGYEGRVLHMDEKGDALEAPPAQRDGWRGPDAESLAYIIYTSGSTGVPKGVAVPHRAVSRLVRGADYLQLAEGDVVVQGSIASFDAATFEVWGALLNGGRLELVEREVTLSPRRYTQFVRARGVTALFMTTALFNQMVREVPGCFSGVGTVLFGGEAVDVESVHRALAQGGQKRLVHVYGPTESTTFASWHEVEEAESSALTIPIGRPISNTQMYVLDERMEPVPVGVPGELYIGGDGLARGYWNRPELTAERFVLDPFSTAPGARLYRSGDRVRFRVDGSIEFLGRVDDQLKIRGFRIEPREVEQALTLHPAVKDALVVAREDASGEKLLVAYLIPENREAPGVRDLMAMLSQRLTSTLR